MPDDNKLIQQMDAQYETMHTTARILLQGVNRIIDLNSSDEHGSVYGLRQLNLDICQATLQELQRELNKPMGGL